MRCTRLSFDRSLIFSENSFVKNHTLPSSSTEDVIMGRLDKLDSSSKIVNIQMETSSTSSLNLVMACWSLSLVSVVSIVLILFPYDFIFVLLFRSGFEKLTAGRIYGL